MDNRGFLLITILFVGLMGWLIFFQNPATQTASTGAASQNAEEGPALATPAVKTAETPFAEPAPAPATRHVTVSTPNYVAVFDEQGGRLASFTLKGYSKRKVNPEMPDQMVELVAQPKREDWSMRLSLNDENAPKLENAPFLADRESLVLEPGETGRLTMTYQDPGGLTVTRRLTFSGDTFLVNQQVTLENGGSGYLAGGDNSTPLYLTMRLNAAPFTGQAGRYSEMGAYINNRLVTERAGDAADGLLAYRGKLTRVDWIGYMDQYFLTALVMPDQSENPAMTPPALMAVLQDHGGLATGVSRPVDLAPGKKAVYDFDFYYGPKSNHDLNAAGHHLNKSVDLGWFSFLATPLAILLRWIYGWVGNYGVAIILVTLLIKILLWPLTAKSYRSMKEMQKLGPKVAKLREKYGDNKEVMNREIMQLYKTFKVNPLGGCLPMLLQIPFFIAFYRVLDSLLELRGAPFILWIQDLAAPDRLFSFNFSIPFFEPPTGIPVLTLLMGASMILQQKMTPTTLGDPIQAKMMMMMPIIFTFILINMPAGLVLYWLVNNILSIGQQAIINRPAKTSVARA